jgi:predicted nucleic acid-binding protein
MGALMKAVFDTNILIDYLRGIADAKKEIARYQKPSISIVTWMEVLAGASDAQEAQLLRNFLSQFHVHALTDNIAERAVVLRRSHNIRLPDAIIWATAQELGQTLVTRNTRDFPTNGPNIRVPYRV